MENIIYSLDAEEKLSILGRFFGVRRILFEYYCLDSRSKKFPSEYFNKILGSKIRDYIHFKKKIFYSNNSNGKENEVAFSDVKDDSKSTRIEKDKPSHWISNIRLLINIEQRARFDIDFGISDLSASIKKDFLKLIERKKYCFPETMIT